MHKNNSACIIDGNTKGTKCRKVTRIHCFKPRFFFFTFHWWCSCHCCSYLTFYLGDLKNVFFFRPMKLVFLRKPLLGLKSKAWRHSTHGKCYFLSRDKMVLSVPSSSLLLFTYLLLWIFSISSIVHSFPLLIPIPTYCGVTNSLSKTCLAPLRLLTNNNNHQFITSSTSGGYHSIPTLKHVRVTSDFKGGYKWNDSTSICRSYRLAAVKNKEIVPSTNVVEKYFDGMSPLLHSVNV